MVKFHKQTCKSYYIIFTKPLNNPIYICSLGFRATLPCRAHLPTSARYGSTPRLRSSLRGQYQQRPALLKPTSLLENTGIKWYINIYIYSDIVTNIWGFPFRHGGTPKIILNHIDHWSIFQPMVTWGTPSLGHPHLKIEHAFATWTFFAGGTSSRSHPGNTFLSWLGGCYGCKYPGWSSIAGRKYLH